MSTAKPTSWLKIEIHDLRPDVDADAVIDILNSTLKALKAINKQASTFGTENIRWRFADISKRSPISATLVGEPIQRGVADDVAVACDAFVGGMRHLEREATCPPLFDEQTLGIARHYNGLRAKGINRVSFATEKQAVEATKNVTQNAGHAIRLLEVERKQNREYGTVEGILLSLSITKDQHSQPFVIYDSLTGDMIKCYFSTREIKEKARAAWEHRVCVTGELRVDSRTGNPTSVKVDDIEILRSRDEIPQLDDVEGIDITGGMDSADYVRKMRDDAYD